jgi:hypothetical protein
MEIQKLKKGDIVKFKIKGSLKVENGVVVREYEYKELNENMVKIVKSEIGISSNGVDNTIKLDQLEDIKIIP